MYKAIEIQNETTNCLIRLAKNFLMDIISKRINEGIYDEDPDGHYSIEPSESLNVEAWVADTYSFECYLEKMGVKEICLDTDVYLVMENGDEIYLRALPVGSIVDICNDLEDIYDEEVAE